MGQDKDRRRIKKQEIDEEIKKAKEAKSRQSMVFMVVFVIALAGMLGALIYFMESPGQEGYEPITPITPVTPQGNQNVATEISIPVSDVTTSAKFYSYVSSGVTVRYFLVKGSDGQIHIAADACDVCYAQKKGYQQVGEEMKCNNCGQKFAVNSIGTSNTAGGCWPSYIPLRIDGGNIIIKNTDLDTKRFMFS